MRDWLDEANVGMPASTPVPKTRDGNPFFALRVPAELLEAFRAYAEDVGESPTALVRAYMAKVTGRQP